MKNAKDLSLTFSFLPSAYKIGEVALALALACSFYGSSSAFAQQGRLSKVAQPAPQNVNSNTLPPMPGQVVYTGAPVQEKLTARIFSGNTTFENIFYKNLVRELEIEKEKNRVIQNNLLVANSALQLTKFLTALPPAQVGEAVEIGLADITILPLSAYQNAPSATLDLLDYPFMFGSLEQIGRKYTAASSVLYPELNARSADSIPVAIMPYSYRIYASQTPNLTAQTLQQDNLGVADSGAVRRVYSYVKAPDTLITNEKAMPSAQVIETTILDFYDRRYFDKFKTVYASQHSLKSAVVLVGKNWWSTLTPQQQNMLTQALSRSVSKSQEEVLNFNSIVLNSLETQGAIQVKRVDYNKDFLPVRQALNKIHYANAKNPYLLQIYNLLK